MTAMASVQLPSILPILEAAPWSCALSNVARSSLEYRQDFPRVAERFEAWWGHDCIDRPVLIAAADTNSARPISKRLELLDDPPRWLSTKFADMLQWHRVGDTLPAVRVDFGPVMLGGLLGGRTEFSSNTTWTHRLIDGDDWCGEPEWTLSDDQPWFRLLRTLTELLAEHAKGRYLVCTPDLGGSCDVLLNLRGSSGLCLDVLERPDRVRAAVDAIYAAWHKAFTQLYRSTLPRGAGLIHWLGLWSNRPYMIPACDFCCMIGPREFESVCLPDIERQARTVGRAVFHLDGPGAPRHIDALLSVDALDAIQFTPGAASPSALAWVDMFRKIQARGKSVLVICPARELLELCERLSPQGLAIVLGDALPPAALDELFRSFRGHYGIAGAG